MNPAELLEVAEEKLATDLARHIDQTLRVMHLEGQSPQNGWRLAVTAENRMDGLKVVCDYGFARIPPDMDPPSDCVIFGWQ